VENFPLNHSGGEIKSISLKALLSPRSYLKETVPSMSVGRAQGVKRQKPRATAKKINSNYFPFFCEASLSGAAKQTGATEIIDCHKQASCQDNYSR
jgi:hypothetical protein